MTHIQTSLGYDARLAGTVWVLDLAELPILHGLSVLSRALAERISQQARTERIDINVEYEVHPRENPELLELFGVSLVKVQAEHECVRDIADHPVACEHHLRALLGNLQRRDYREALFAADGVLSRALVADFSGASTEMPNRFLLEFVPAASGGGYLRITIEDPGGRRLDLATVPHVRIESIEERSFIAGSTRIAQTWAEGLRREAERGRRTFGEARTPYSHLFRQFDRAGLEAFERVAIQWSDVSMPLILEGEPIALENLMKRVVLALEDGSIRDLLSEGALVRVDSPEGSVFLDVSQLGRVLNLSLGERRQRRDVDGFLARMPALESVVRSHAGQPLADTSVFLVHHMTAEVLGVIAALRRLGCRDLTCLFVVYGGEAPASYVEAALEVPTDEFRSLALVHVPAEGQVEGHYRLSSQYSELDERGVIERALQRLDGDYLESMRAAAVPAFLGLLERARAAGRACLIVEDGGYVAPELNRGMLAGERVDEWLARFGIDSDDRRALDERLAGVWIGSVEHTRNGHDRLAEVEARHGRLARPAFSIAVSRLKREVESREVAVSLLNALENVLGAGGRVLSRRRCLVLGSRGAIGGHLMRELSQRLEGGTTSLLGVDLTAPESGAESGARETRSLDELPESERLGVDVVLGVTGTSILTGTELEAWLLAGQRDELVLASGSTKTLEFTDAARWLEALLAADRPAIQGTRVEISSQNVTDARTGRVYGQRYTFAFPGAERLPRTLLLLANLTPINFLFYGVPTELIDEVLAQLVSVSVGLVERAGSEEVEPGLLPVDERIDGAGRPLA